MIASLDALTQEKINLWLSGNYDADTKARIQQLLDEGKETELTDSFYKDLEFGTGGMRGEMGVGSNRMNKYTVGSATQGFANYLKANFTGESISVAIAHDSRNNASFFAKVAADIFSANGIKVFLFKELRPTPELSFAVRHLGCNAGLVITASHNPREYNGYKAYWNDGSQVVAPHDKNIVAEVNKIQSVDEINFTGNPDLITLIGEEIDAEYLKTIQANSINPDVITRQKDLKIVYSSIHGTGITLVPKALKLLGFEDVNVVEAQAEPNGDFPTVIYPNPEETEAMTLAMNLAKEIDADLVIATDPDADRVGAAVKNPAGEWVLLNGNQMASLIIYYLLDAWKKAGKLTGKEFVAKTIVTTNIIDKMCETQGVKCYNTLTGFKFIAAVIRELEGKEKFIGGGEESYGYLIGDAVRDKDAIASCAMIAELTAYAKDNGKSLFDFLTSMYMENNFYYEGLISLTKKGKAGAEEIQKMMADLRSNVPATVAGSEPVTVIDYTNLTSTDLKSGAVTNIPTGLGMEASNVIQLVLADGTKVSARPSGTEPKIKFYVSVNEPLEKAEDFETVLAKLKLKVSAIQEDLGLK
ncbi:MULTISPECIES: phospho-sugar mutase [unclassified Arcicella]|uniref:phospho-sugar mutase n=1 Tax=unclassified Arcicella TaxID=2644986 RepID=UPI00285E77E2|nr:MULTISPECIES: phospho-sugar mutase [unclassified Arcicella]MDR6560559.1 phosphoglucomutase [Arcicella sp. BE51]MDR6809835.1 phosphoglucomutase [Arcicella sp. BE140]MDR6821184.1 phosphoglucomutase [Arcicella sp. BE139]